MWQNLWDSHWEMPVQTMDSHENVEPIRCITSRIIQQIIIKFVCSCNISNFDQFRSIQISTSSASPTCQQGWWAAARGSCCIAASRSETVLASHSNALERFPPSVCGVLGWRCWHSSPTRSKRPSPRTGCCGAYCKGPVEGRTCFNMVQHGWTRLSNLYLGPLMEFPSLTMTRMRLVRLQSDYCVLLYSSRMSFSCLVCLVHHVSSRYLQKVGRIG